VAKLGFCHSKENSLFAEIIKFLMLKLSNFKFLMLKLSKNYQIYLAEIIKFLTDTHACV